MRINIRRHSKDRLNHSYQRYMLFMAAAFLAVIPTTGEAEVTRKAQTAFRFLEQPVSAEAVGRGTLGLVMFRNANAVFWNPAGLGWIEARRDVNFNYTRGIADINQASFAASLQLPGAGVLAFDGLMMDYGELYGTRREDNAQGYLDTEVFSPQALAFGVSYGHRVSDRFSYGVRGKYAWQDLGDAWIGRPTTEAGVDTVSKNYSESEYALDVGTIYDFQVHGLRFGAAIQNYSERIKFEDQESPLPFVISFSIMADPLSILVPGLEGHKLNVGLESRHPRDFGEKLLFGAEYTFQDMFIVRGGYMSNYDQRGLTFGLGVRQSSAVGQLRFDYAYQDFGLFQAVHIFSLGISR